MTRRLFGTDGIRGVALEPPLDRGTVSRLGAALAEQLRETGVPLRVLLAGDTRASSPVLARWLGGAFRAAGGDVRWAGVLPTPAVSHLVRNDGEFGAGVIISASHNPANDNGIKLLRGCGTKWPVGDERQLEQRLSKLSIEPRVAPLPEADGSFQSRYLALLQRTLGGRSLAGMRLVVDAANGAASPLVVDFFSWLGAEVRAIHANPDGANINLRCGALHPDELAERVVQERADVGVALDGDADRAILVTHTGRTVDGDEVLFLWGKTLAEEGRLPGRTVVATVMSNLGLELALNREGFRLVRCPVGDREVWDTMVREGAALGGEQSGHVICSHHAVTGDGLLTAAHILAEVCQRGAKLDEITKLERFPQVLLNVRVSSRRPLLEVPELAAAVSEAEAVFAGNGRVLVRYSGTEPLLRIMVEAPTAMAAKSAAERLATVARHHLGAG